MSGRRLCWPSITVNWFTASQSFAVGVVEIHQPHMIAGDGAVGAAVLDRARHRAASGERPGWSAMSDGVPTPQHLAQGLLAGLVGNGRVQPLDGLAQAPDQHHVAKRVPLGRRFAGRDVRAVADRIAQFLEPGQGGVFDGGFVEAHFSGNDQPMRLRILSRH